MRKLLPLLCFLLLSQLYSAAQYVTIPDTSFRNKLKISYPTCFNASDMMDTTCSSILSATNLFVTIDSTILNLDGLQYFKGLITLNCYSSKITFLPKLSPVLQKLYCNNNLQLTSLPNLPNSLQTVQLINNKLTTLPNLPASILTLDCSKNQITTLPSLPIGLTSLTCAENFLTSFPTLPSSLTELNFRQNLFTIFPTLPAGITFVDCSTNQITNLPTLPTSLGAFYCAQNLLTSLPALPNSLINFSCNQNLLTSLPALPSNLAALYCSANQLTSLPTLPSSLTVLHCSYNNISSLQTPLPPRLKILNITKTKIAYLPTPLPDTLQRLWLGKNPNLVCLPKFPKTLINLFIDTLTRCIPNSTSGLITYSFTNIDSVTFFTYGGFNPPVVYPQVCNPTNNPNQCISYPYITGKIYRDINSNNTKEANEQYAPNIKVQLKPNNYTYTNAQGKYELVADTIGATTLTITPPNFYNAAPAIVAYNFAAYNNSITQPDIALQPNTTKDSIKITVTPTNWAARPGFRYPYLITYENIGTTQPTANLSFTFNDTLLTYDSSSRVGVLNPTVNTLTYSTPTMLQGQRESWIAYFKVKTNATLGKALKAKATVAYNAVNTADSITTIIQGSYDPNDKKATPQLTPTQVAEGSFIDYTVRFQNTGTDTAFTVVIADTLSSLLQASSLQTIEASHTCKTTVRDNIVFFEFLNINLPDSNRNKIGSNGFVRFRVKPVTTVVNGNQVNNKVAIYFDYNSPIITNTATTQIANPPLPLQLLALSAVAHQNNQQVLVYFNTTNESKTAYFDIEQSTDAQQFSKATSLNSMGNGSHNYFTTIARALSNNTPATTMYLRLKMVDKDGKHSYSNIVKLTFQKNATTWDIVGNPTNDFLNIVVKTSIATNSKAQLINSTGVVVNSFVLVQGLQSINIKQLPAGTYYVQTEMGTKQVVVVR
jgi:uncharacterized repeat protein (TIGR01451 family)